LPRYKKFRILNVVSKRIFHFLNALAVFFALSACFKFSVRKRQSRSSEA